MSQKLPTIRFLGTPCTKTGYGNATINMAKAFSQSKVRSSFEFDIKGAVGHESAAESRINFHMQTPPFMKCRQGKYNIGYFYWEADTLPVVWAKNIRKSLDEIWVPCKITKKACLKAGFQGPIEVVPTPMLIGEDPLSVKIPSERSRDRVISDNIFKFYSVFQWNERKGYSTLLRAFYRSFDKFDNVILVLKTNPIIHRGHGLKKIYSDIKKYKRSVSKRGGSLPKVFLSTDFLSREHIVGLHKLCDAFVLPHSGEGWGMPIHDAMLQRSFVIATKFGGITEYLSYENSFFRYSNLNSSEQSRWSIALTSLVSVRLHSLPQWDSLIGSVV